MSGRTTLVRRVHSRRRRLLGILAVSLIVPGCVGAQRGHRFAGPADDVGERPPIASNVSQTPPAMESAAVVAAADWQELSAVEQSPRESGATFAHWVRQAETLPDDPLPDDPLRAESPQLSLETADGGLEPLPKPPAETVAPLADAQETPLAGNPEAPVLSLDQAIAVALVNDPVLRAGLEEIAVARGDWVTSSLKPNPELEIIQSLLPLGRPFEADVNEGGPPQFDIMVAYPIDWYLFGKRAAAMRSASAEVRVSRAEYADLIRERILAASLAFYDVMEAQALVDLAQQDSDNLMMVENATAIAVENGAVPRVELSRIRLDRLNSQQTLREAVRDLRIAKAELLAALGGVLPPGIDARSDFRVSDQLMTDGVDLEVSTDVEQVLAAAIVNRPDIQALQLRISQTRLEIEAQRREAYPEVTPMLGYTRQFQQRAIGFPDANSWGAGVAMTLPIHDRNQGNRLSAAAQWRQSNHALQAGLVELEAEVVTVVAELETARVNAAAIAEDQLQLAEQVRDAIRTAYEAGGRPLIDVLDSQRNFRETYGNYIASRANYLRAVERLNAVVGAQR